MKNILIVAFISIASISFAQNQQRVYGPKAKNEKVWINKSNKSIVVTNTNKNITGGVAKNNQTWVKNEDKTQTIKIKGNEEKMALKGPNAKNYKPYNKSKSIHFNETINQNMVQTNDTLNQQKEILTD
ncbi:hypothetical protein [Carboxylicivirga caseinilyticus]|uniref:hypothetical protein n=1 Tax=Carboxylicivirga caseinilyticus TaxID=3417572 RepID=UPI003D3365A8|nr:hypothetical protein [Marinilabiliaceae bacterium A049]